MPTLYSFAFLAPAAPVIVALLAFRDCGRRPGKLPLWSELSALTALVLCFLGLIQFLAIGPITTGATADLAFIGLRADKVSISISLLVAFLGWIVVRYSRSYIDGEAREGMFHGQMLLTFSAVMVFAQAASLPTLAAAGIGVGIGLKHLLLFYKHRPEARRAATKFSLVWHGGDAVLLAATLILGLRYGTVELTALPVAIDAQGLGLASTIGIALIVLAAVLKTASFPVHGWLTEVMEAPTPVSAFLHAGIVNSGGVLLIATAGVVQFSPGSMAALAMIGGFTALFGAAVMLTQSAVKTALAWSTVAQMGFMLLQCGLGVWALALLHILAHSLYKAHAFLSSGGAVRAVAGTRRPGPIAVPSLGAVVKSFCLAIGLYAAIAILFALFVGEKSPQATALGAILIFGVAYLVAQGLADAAPAALTKRTAILSLGTGIAYFTFQSVAESIWGGSLPTAPAPGPLEWATIVLAVLSFGMVAFAQALFPLWAHHPATAGIRVHVANGLYLNALLDRAIGGFRTQEIRAIGPIRKEE